MLRSDPADLSFSLGSLHSKELAAQNDEFHLKSDELDAESRNWQVHWKCCNVVRGMGHDQHCHDYCPVERGPVREVPKEIVKAVLEEKPNESLIQNYGKAYLKGRKKVLL